VRPERPIPGRSSSAGATIAAASARSCAFVAYDGHVAAELLRLKLRNGGTGVVTAENLIRPCGSSSSVSGQPYRIRFADGRTIDAAQCVRARLAEFKP
jgi:hypothetical protein